MGVPKFYRWISERYPCLSEVVKEYQIPEFDNLYLDMNGIIHICSHPNDNDPHFRISEEKIFKDIFHYIEVLFRLIQPRKVFFMAVDGVAPRAKMNQQRGRRFRSAREAVESEKKAQENGEVLPTEERFDSNCITPGTPFMARLDAQLQYFVTSKISQDKLWQGCKVIYSGHQTPGEGEHKIMEYIRYSKSQPEYYNPNTRHCLYGLDADLMMLGLTSHEPHFSLLREEVRFGGKKEGNRRTPTPEETTFHLLHLTLMREYINYEFSELHHALPFTYDLENIIDDWVLMGFLVGNDFIPHLPNLHINKGALPILYTTYKQVLPTLDGYLNEGGRLNLKRFEKFMAKLTEFDVEQFHELNADLKCFEGKKSKDGKAFKVNKGNGDVALEPFFDDEAEGAGMFGALEDDDDQMARLTETYAKLNYEVDPMFDEDGSDSEESTFDAEFRQHKTEYYMTKMNFRRVNSEVLYEQATSYVRGIQWILNYYYNGICSWSWYYPFHYSPYISDIKDFANMELDFEMGRAFLPYEQLLAVLPPLSKTLLPLSYQGLMTNEESPLKKFYPDTFSTDLNGKQQDWEAVVLIPFIDEELLLESMAKYNSRLSSEEKSRNVHGPMYIYTYTSENLGEYQAPKFFPPVGMNHASVELLMRDRWEITPEKIYKGLCKGVARDIFFHGFPTLQHIPHKFHVGQEGVKVFQNNSRGDNYILDIIEPSEDPSIKDVANQLLGKEVFVSWPHLVEAKVEAVSDREERYFLANGEVHKTRVEGNVRESFTSSKNSIASHYHDRWGVNIHHTSILIYAVPMTGRKYVPTSDGRLSLEKEWSRITQPYAYQTVVKDIRTLDPGYKQHLTPQEYFPIRTKVFMLGQPHYGCMGEVIEIDPSHKGRIRVAMTVPSEPKFDVVMQKQSQLTDKYMSSYHAGQKVGMSSHLVSRLTGTVFLAPPSGSDISIARDNRNKLNIGLNLKNNVKNEEVCGYSRKCKDPNGRLVWMYSDLTVDALREYQAKFPEIFSHLSSELGKRDIFFQQDVFGTEDYKSRVAELTEWLKSANFCKAERQVCGTEALSNAVVACLAEEVDKVSVVRAKTVKMQVRPHLLYKPNQMQGCTPPDHTVSYKMFDRVVNIREGFSVPLGARGTIIGIQPAEKPADVLYDVLFDEAFAGGLTLRGPVSAQRSYRLHWATMINLTHGNRTPPTSYNTQRFEPTPYQTVTIDNRWEHQRRDAQHNGHYAAPVRWEQHGRGMGNGQPNTGPTQLHMGPSQAHMVPPQPYMRSCPSQPHTRDSYNTRPRGHNAGVIPDTHSLGPQKGNSSTDSNPQPPDPRQLPLPSGLQFNQGHQGGSFKSQASRPHQEKLKEIKCAEEVECVVHATYYASWSKIKQQGISRPSQHQSLIPCYSCSPKNISGSKAYQLYIFIDVRKAMEDGIKFYRVSDKQVLCSGDQRGVIKPQYFSHVVDAESGHVIFSSASTVMPGPSPGVSAPPQHHNHRPGPAAQGRGSTLPSGSQPTQLFQNIWSQVQGLDTDHVDLRPLQSQMLSQMLNIPAASEDSPGFTQAPAAATANTADGHASSRSTASESLLQGLQTQQAGACGEETSIMSMLHAAQQSYHSKQASSSQKAQSPAKSPFVPTQVIRNQTPRKPKANQRKSRDSQQHSQDGADEAQFSQQQQQQQQGPPHGGSSPHSEQNRANGVAASQSRRPPRSRLAVKFDQFSQDSK